jgi:DNA replication licensing factor MCM6
MYVDVSHLSAFAHEDPEFMRNVAHHYTKYEPDLRRALERFMYDSAADSQSMKKSYFQIAMYNLPSMSKIRELRTLSLGRLMAIYGTVTRTTDAKPELILGTF